MLTVALDVMGGDYSGEEIVKGAKLALENSQNLFIKLVGKKDLIESLIEKLSLPKDRVSVVESNEIITNEEAPVMAVRTKKDSSIVVGMNLVKEGKAGAFVSAGSTGAVLVGGQLIVGRIKGVLRAALAPVLPTKKGVSLLIDCGANVDARAEHLVQFAKMGSIYMEKVFGIDKPKVGIVNIGAEEEKGNALVKETFPLLKKSRDINFTGSIEAREIPSGDCDVIVCEAFTGNVILKLYEGLGKTLLSEIKNALTENFLTKIGALLIKSALKRKLKKFDSSEQGQGGAPMLGLKGLVIKAHGNSKANEISKAILQCISFDEQNITSLIEASMAKTE